MRYTVLCDGQPVGVVDLSAPDEGSAEGLLEPLPAFGRVGPVLERWRRLQEEATTRLLKAELEGRLRDRLTHRPATASRTWRCAR